MAEKELLMIQKESKRSQIIVIHLLQVNKDIMKKSKMRKEKESHTPSRLKSMLWRKLIDSRQTLEAHSLQVPSRTRKEWIQATHRNESFSLPMVKWAIDKKSLSRREGTVRRRESSRLDLATAIRDFAWRQRKLDEVRAASSKSDLKSLVVKSSGRSN